MIDDRIKYWTQGWPQKNFGDYLSEYLHDEALLAPIVDADRYRLIGSTIDASLLEADLAECGVGESARIALWGCGKRDASPLSDSLLARCQFLGVRGPLTRDLLGLPSNTPVGDPAFVLPLVLPEPRTPRSGRICVPHYNEPTPHAILMERSGADELVLPGVADVDHLKRLIRRIASAEFVLAGSLHAAIVACAYGVPFAFWDTGYIDIPFKWHDFAASIGVSLPFCKSVEEGIQAHAQVEFAIRLPRVSSILSCCPFAVKPELIVLALARDEGLDEATQETLRRAARASAFFDSESLRQQNESRREGLRALATTARTGVFAAGDGWVGDMVARIGRATTDIEAALSGMRFVFGSAASGELRFRAGAAGHAFLRRGWTEPNEIGPWAVDRHAEILLPATTRWWAWKDLHVSIIAFAPSTPPINGSRNIDVRANDFPLESHVVHNPASEPVVATTLVLRLPEVLCRRGGDLLLTFGNSMLESAATLGIGADTRTLAFAAVSMQPHN